MLLHACNTGLSLWFSIIIVMFGYSWLWLTRWESPVHSLAFPYIPTTYYKAFGSIKIIQTIAICYKKLLQNNSSDDPLHCTGSQCSISHGAHMQGCTIPYIWQHFASCVSCCLELQLLPACMLLICKTVTSEQELHALSWMVTVKQGGEDKFLYLLLNLYCWHRRGDCCLSTQFLCQCRQM